MALIKLRNLPPSNPGDFTGQNLLAVALNDENLDRETKSFSCHLSLCNYVEKFAKKHINFRFKSKSHLKI